MTALSNMPAQAMLPLAAYDLDELLRNAKRSEQTVLRADFDPEAIARVADEAWPEARNPEEVHDALLGFVAITEPFVREWRDALHAPSPLDCEDAD